MVKQFPTRRARASYAFLGLSAVFTMFCAAPSAVQARDFIAYQSTTPVLYLYAACIFEADQPTAEQQIDKCALEKKTLLEQSKGVIETFHTRDRVKVRRELEKGLQEIDKDAVWSRKQGKPVPATIVSYLKCMAERVIATDDFKSGAAIDYIGIEPECSTQDVPVDAVPVTEQALDRERILYLRFRRLGRLTYPLMPERTFTRGSSGMTKLVGPQYDGRLRPAVAMTGSFLDLAILPADKKNDE